jgi:NAD-dependent SIR2 family protein deacetylase
MKNPTKAGQHMKMAANLAQGAACASPTPFHRLLKELAGLGCVRRVYTQNIDGLEMKAGLTATEPNPTCVQLHGSVMDVVCTRCSFTEHIYRHFPAFRDGLLPNCPDCDIRIEERRMKEQRLYKSGFLRPHVILYHETHPRADEIGAIATEDAGKADLVLVVGTSLETYGAVLLMKGFSSSLRKRGNGGAVYFLNLEKPDGKHLHFFDDVIQIDCQAFATEMLERMKPTSPGPNKLRTGTADLDSWASARRVRYDVRPSWDWV